jgi:uncharacterized protein
LGKLIFLLVLVIVVWAVVKSYVKSSRARDSQPRVTKPEDMVRCLHCGVHLPRSESLTSGGNFFCSEDHLRLHG